MKKPLVMLLAGGGGTRLGTLVRLRAKPAVPFAGCYRVIDFALSNVMHADLDWVGLLTQYKPLSLMRHVGVGGAWNLRGRKRGVRILPPRTGEDDFDWYRGTADAIWQNFDFMESMRPERVLILSGDHIYRMDYQRMLAEHLDKRADLSIAVMPVAAQDVSRFGMIWANAEGVIERFEEKPAEADTQLASMGIYLFEWSCLSEALRDIVATRQGFDFGFDIMSRLIGERRVIAHRFDGYWRDVGTISSYFQANMDCLDPGSGLDLGHWQICTREEASPGGDPVPAWLGRDANCRRSLVSAGCIVEGAIRGSILSPGVRVGPGAVVENAIIMDGVRIGSQAQIRNAVVDKNAVVGIGAHIGADRPQSENSQFAKCQMDGISVIGKGVHLPDRIQVGANVMIGAGVLQGDFSGDLADGASLLSAEGEAEAKVDE